LGKEYGIKCEVIDNNMGTTFKLCGQHLTNKKWIKLKKRLERTVGTALGPFGRA
jgi:hypothetical protein